MAGESCCQIMDLRCNIKPRSDSPPELVSPRATTSSDNLPQDLSIADCVDQSSSIITSGDSEPISDVTRRRRPLKRNTEVSRGIDALTARICIPPTSLGPQVPMRRTMRIPAYGHGKNESGLDSGEVASGDNGAKATQLNLKSGDCRLIFALKYPSTSLTVLQAYDAAHDSDTAYSVVGRRMLPVGAIALAS